MSKVGGREQVISDEDEIFEATSSLAVRAFCHHGNLFRGRPLHLFDLELSVIEISVKQPVDASHHQCCRDTRNSGYDFCNSRHA
jgi:hypothetical protein